MEVFTRFTNSFDAAVKNMLKTAADQTQKCQNHYKREFQTIGKAFLQLGQAMEQDNNYGKLYETVLCKFVLINNWLKKRYAHFTPIFILY